MRIQKEHLEYLIVREGYTREEIAALFRTSKEEVAHQVRTYGIRKPSPREIMGVTKSWLKEQREVLLRTCKDIADELGIDGGVVVKWCRQDGLEITRGKIPQTKEPLTEMWFRTSVVEDKLTVEELAERFNVCERTIRNWLRAEGLETYDSKHPSERFSRRWYYNRYVRDRLSMKSIADMLGCCEGTIRNRLVERNIQIRS